ncbi:hypothetical protein [Pseudomonas sp. RIT-PI-S]|uniref:hypothetical protein n=1 Tax=Pseudomonas sp. RIT-PI-S TaxID=3035295 RepID=UPI0021D8600B|nr:hypothetical protein [Pseudomonas sp. RIT-PI-S]
MAVIQSNTAGLELALDAITAWETHWALRGERLTCRHCGSSQGRWQSRQPFQHRRTCDGALLADPMPWVALPGWQG